jgi:hypothetical protein
LLLFANVAALRARFETERRASWLPFGARRALPPPVIGPHATRDVDEAVFLGDGVVVLSAQPGAVKAELPIELPLPRTRELLTSPDFTSLKREAFELLLGADSRDSGLREVAPACMDTPNTWVPK